MADLLIVEDDPTLLEGLIELLSMQGHQVRGADCGEAALEAIEARPPEVIVSDVLMPGMKGTELLETVRRRPDWAAIPFVFVSASITPVVRRDLATMPSVTFLLKPFDIERLFEAVMEALA